MNAGKPPLTYKQFQRIIEGMEPPAKPVPTLTLQVTIRIAVLQRLLEISSWVRPTFEFPRRDLMLSFSDAGQLHDAVAR